MPSKQKKFEFSYDTMAPEEHYDSFRAQGITSMIESPKMTELVNRVTDLEDRMTKVEGAVIRAIGSLEDIKEAVNAISDTMDQMEGE